MTKRMILAPTLSLVAAGAWADVTVMGVNSSQSGNGPSIEGPYTFYVKDNQMRLDDDGTGTTMLIRPGGSGEHEYVFLDHGRRHATILPRQMADVGEVATNASGGLQTINQIDSVETPLLGYDVSKLEYQFEGAASMPTEAGNGGQEVPPELANMMKITMVVNGTAWVSSDVEGYAELSEFYQRIGSEMTNVGDGIAGITRGLTDVMARLSSHGFPLKTTMTTRIAFAIDAPGPMRAMLERMLSSLPNTTVTSTSEVTEISTAPVDATLFYGGGLPEGYTQEVLDFGALAP